jgi:hypothetical protein
MAGRPRKPIVEKECPRCSTKHTKRGKYCCYSCANVREHSELDKINKSLSVSRYYKTSDKAEMHIWQSTERINAARASRTDATIVIPTREDIEPALPPMEDEYDYSNRRSGRDIWFDAD